MGRLFFSPSIDRLNSPFQSIVGKAASIGGARDGPLVPLPRCLLCTKICILRFLSV